ncbi:sugar kinase [Bradyrhizobium sp. dw_411]|uniref:sugar kinase n=1 Tax=Bradyrhizobium sp. dw_411 TaxID=2720082 RepID=UPI001BD1B08B|nr:sugar kinase [Bradyrhizobium sp. dw_411]
MAGNEIFAGLGQGNVACLGECMVELVERPDGLLARGYGGDTLNTAVYLARLDVPVRYVTALGDDDLSDAMLAAWSREGIDVSSVFRVPGRVPGLYLIRTDSEGERHFTYWRDSAPVRQLFDETSAQAAEKALAAASVIYLSGISLSLFSGEARGRLFGSLGRLRQGGRRIVFDSNFRPRGWRDISDALEAYDQILRMADMVLAGEDDFKLLNQTTGASLIDFLARYELPEVVVKLMKPGCVVLAEGSRTDVPVAAVVQPLDTTAAGDSFAAAYLAARLKGMRPAKAAIAGHALASVVIRHSGAILPQDAMPADLFGTPSNLDQS